MLITTELGTDRVARLKVAYSVRWVNLARPLTVVRDVAPRSPGWWSSGSTRSWS